VLTSIIVSGNGGIEEVAIRAAGWFGLFARRLTKDQQRRLRRPRRSRRRYALCNFTWGMAVLQAQGTLWFTDEPTFRPPRTPKTHPFVRLNIQEPRSPEAVGQWIKAHRINTLHIARGNGSDAFVFAYLCKVFTAAGRRFHSGYSRRPSKGSILLIDKAKACCLLPWPNLKCQGTAERFAKALQVLRRQALVPANRAFLEGIPMEAREALFRFRDSHRQFVSLFTRFGRPIADLVRGQAWMLVYMLCHPVCAPAINKMDNDARRGLLSQKQRTIWAKYGLPDAESTARIMRKIPAECCSILLLHAMRRVLNDQRALSIISRLDRINLGAVRVEHDNLLEACLESIAPRACPTDCTFSSRARLLALRNAS
jgi:hypothetical protein